MTENLQTETMWDKWNDRIDVMTVKESINEYPTVYITFSSDNDHEDDAAMILDLAGLDQLIALLQNARERLTEDVD